MMNFSYKPNFEGKVAVVTGGAGVLCSVFAEALALCGARVAVLDLAEDRAQTVVETIRKSCEEAGVSTKVIAVGTNVLEKESLQMAHQRIQKELGLCDILINGAGGNNARATTDCEFYDEEILKDPMKKSFFDLEPSGISFVFGLNFNGALLPTQEFALDMVKKNAGNIINISSMNAYTPLTKIPAYSAAKAAISNFTQWLAVHFAKTGIRVNAIAPGFFSTIQNKTLLWNPDGTPTARTGKILSQTPMGRFGEPQELLGTLMYLLDDQTAGFVTGIVVPVDGGFSAYSGV